MGSWLPLVSVLIAARNEAAAIEGCLDAVGGQRYPAERLDVVLIDGMSTDGTVARAQQWAARHGRPVRIMENPRRITPAAFNVGIRAAKGDVIIILGTHARVAPDFVAMSIAALERTGADVVGGVVRTVAANGRVVARAIGLAQRSPFGVGDARYRYGTVEGAVDTVNYGAYRREVFERIGLFDETLHNGEDCELNYRLRAAGGRLVLVPAIQIDYLARPSLGALWQQRYRWGRYKPEIAQRHLLRQMRPRHAVPGVFVAALLTGLALWPAGGRRRWLLGGTLGSYAAATTVATLRLGARNGWPGETFFLPLSFATMHVAYGLGTLIGLLRFGVAALQAAARPRTSSPRG